METIAKYASEIWSFIGGLAGGLLGGSLLTLRFTRKTTTTGQGTNVSQARATAGGDIVGRDKKVGRDQHS